MIGVGLSVLRLAGGGVGGGAGSTIRPGDTRQRTPAVL